MIPIPIRDSVPRQRTPVVTIALTLGAQRMLKRRVLVRRLAAVETLGSVTVICSPRELCRRSTLVR